jgi:hypothetical protein
MIEANRASSSWNEVSMRTWVWGRPDRISRVASMPLSSARRTSITTTSGRARSACSTAPCASSASPTTRMSSTASSIERTPPRTISWSSTNRTRMGGLIASPPPGGPVRGKGRRSPRPSDNDSGGFAQSGRRRGRLASTTQSGRSKNRKADTAWRSSLPEKARQAGYGPGKGGFLSTSSRVLSCAQYASCGRSEHGPGQVGLGVHEAGQARAETPRCRTAPLGGRMPPSCRSGKLFTNASLRHVDGGRERHGREPRETSPVPAASSGIRPLSRPRRRP